MVAQRRCDEAKPQLDAARFGFDELLRRYPLAFADHAAEFYAGSGNDCLRALELARTNVANRPTHRAVRQADAIAARCAAVKLQSANGPATGDHVFSSPNF